MTDDLRRQAVQAIFRLHKVQPKRTIPISGANIADMRRLMDDADLATKLYLSAIEPHLKAINEATENYIKLIDSQIEPYNENCPVTETLRFGHFAGGLNDLLADEISGPLERFIGRREGYL